MIGGMTREGRPGYPLSRGQILWGYINDKIQ